MEFEAIIKISWIQIFSIKRRLATTKLKNEVIISSILAPKSGVLYLLLGLLISRFFTIFSYMIRLIIVFIFNIGILALIGRLFYASVAPETEGTTLSVLLPIVGLIGTYLYLLYWFGKKTAIRILLYLTGSVLLSMVFLFDNSFTKWFWKIIALGFLIGIGYVLYRLFLILKSKFRKI